jgi:hypothetical protein
LFVLPALYSLLVRDKQIASDDGVHADAGDGHATA